MKEDCCMVVVRLVGECRTTIGQKHLALSLGCVVL